MMKNDNKKKGNPTKKILPAAGMLALSASMLATSTYAWFTMSREVEVSNIQMTATVPEDIQISLGKIGTTSDYTTASDSTGDGALAMNTGFLMTSSGAVVAPREDGVANNDIDWSNTVDVSAYYGFGKLIPASSINGEDIIFTPDANGVGKTVKQSAKFYQAADAGTAQSETGIGTNPGSGTFNATAHTYTATSDRTGNSKWTASPASAWNDTNDDGYYIDIPVWLRTSSASVDVGVQAYVVDVAAADATDPLADADTATADDELLYRAVRVAVLDDDGSANSNLIPVADGDSAAAATDKYLGDSVLNWYTRTAATNPDTNGNTAYALKSTGTNNAGEYAAPVTYAGANNTAVATLTGGSGTGYGAAVKKIIRVWIEGEDPDCWNQTAGQDWAINLKFVKKGDATAPSGGSGNTTPVAYSPKANDTYTFTFPSGSNPASIIYTYDGSSWNTDATGLPSTEGSWKIGETTISDLAALATYISNHAPTSGTTSVAVTSAS
jgi:hypothetical protein